MKSFDPALFTIIVVDDNPDFLTITATRLRSSFNVFAANSVSAAFEFYDEKTDAILTDLHMPGSTGKDLISAIREFNPKIPIYIVTANREINSAQVLSWGGNGLFLKPIDMDEVTQTIKSAIQISREK